MGIREFTGMGYCVDNMQKMQAIESQLMTSCGSRKKQSHKSITQMNRTNNHARQDDVMSKNGNDERHFRMLQSNSCAYGGPETV